MNTVQRKEKSKLIKKGKLNQGCSELDEQSPDGLKQNSKLRNSPMKANSHKQKNERNLNELKNCKTTPKEDRIAKKRKFDDTMINKTNVAKECTCIRIVIPFQCKSVKSVFEKIFPYCDDVLEYHARSLTVEVGSEGYHQNFTALKNLRFEGQKLKMKQRSIKMKPRSIKMKPKKIKMKPKKIKNKNRKMNNKFKVNQLKKEFKLLNCDVDVHEVKKYFDAISVAPKSGVLKTSGLHYVLTFKSKKAAEEAVKKAHKVPFQENFLSLWPFREQAIRGDEEIRENKAIEISKYEASAWKKMKTNTGAQVSVKNNLNDNEDVSEDEDDDVEGENEDDDDIEAENDDDLEGENDDEVENEGENDDEVEDEGENYVEVEGENDDEVEGESYDDDEDKSDDDDDVESDYRFL